MKGLVVIDMQKDFMPGGPLGVNDADQLLPLINQLMEKFPLVVATKDWHPKDHPSFGDPWPVHCVQNTDGAKLVSGLNQEKIDQIILKGIEDEGYSAFLNTELDSYLKGKKVETLYFAGVATDFCVLNTALDALKLGYSVFVIEDGCRAIESHGKALDTMREKGVKVIKAEEVG